MSSGTHGYDIAVVGMACRVPGARSLDAFWQNLRNGVESVVPLTAEQLRAAGVPDDLASRQDYVKAAAMLEGMEDFDAGFFGFNPREASILDPQHRHFLECAWEAVEHAGLRPDQMPGPVGVFAGSGHNAYLPYNLLTHPELLESVGLFLLRHTGNDKDFMTTRASHLFDLRGPSIGVQTACSTSLVAVHLACQSLLAGECDVALAGGVTIELPHGQGYRYQEGEILSPDGHCRPFDAAANGTVFGSGVGIVVLRRLSDAVADGDRIWAVVRGSAVNNDGAMKAGYLAPSVDGQAQVIAEALAVADAPASTIGFVEAHGTGTAIGDPIEVAALSQAFASAPAAAEKCVLGSVKSNIGHLDTAAGVVGMIKAILAMVHREIPPTLHFTRPNPSCDLERSPFQVSARLRPWNAGASPRRAGVTSLGVGGTNAHVVLEEAPRSVPSPAAAIAQPLFVSAKSAAALGRSLERLGASLSAPTPPDLADVAFTLARGRVPFPYRRAIVAGSAAEAAEDISRLRNRAAWTPTGDRPAEIAFLFPGGGAQYPGMGGELLGSEPVYRDAIEECLAPLPRADRQRIIELLSVAPTDARNALAMERPSLGLPALFATQAAVARLWLAWGVKPSALIGHSMGEYTAAWLAGVFSLADAMRLVRFRGELFERLPAGGMLSVALDARTLEGQLDPEVSIAAVNAPGLCVASGPAAAINRLETRLKSAGVEHSRLRIATAAHSGMLDGSLQEFRLFLDGLSRNAPSIPIASNLTGAWLTAEEATSADYWVRHLRQTVRFADGLRALLESPDRVLLEIGPGKSLGTLGRANPACGSRRVVLAALRNAQEPGPDRKHLLTAAATLWEKGHPLDRADLFGPGRRRKVPLPTYPFERARHWIAPSAAGASRIRPATKDASNATRLHRVVWERSQAARSAVPQQAWVIHNGDPFASTLGDALSSAGCGVTLVPHEGVEFSAPDTDIPSVVIDVRRPTGASAAAEVEWAARIGLPGLLSLGRTLAERMSERGLELVVVTHDLESITSGGDGSVAQAIVAGGVHSVGAELPAISARHIDLGRARRGSADDALLVGCLVRELGNREPRVALRSSGRWIPEYEPLADATHDDAVLRAGEVCLITGGLGAIGRTLAGDLASVRGARLALLVREELPSRDTWPVQAAAAGPVAEKIRAVLALEEAGAEVMLVAGDVARAEDVTRCVNQIRARWGHITGVIHAAGRLRDRLMWDKAVEEIRRVVEPKVLGALGLEAALEDDPPEWMVYLSSISAIAGLPGQADYAGANAALDAIAHRRARERRGRSVSMAWSAWRNAGMTSVRSRFAGTRVEFTLDPARDWVLNEHRLTSGEPILPGTGFLDLAARTLGIGEEGIQLEDVTVRSPAVVPAGVVRRVACEVDEEGRLSIRETEGMGEEFFSARIAPLPPARPAPEPVEHRGTATTEAGTAEASGAIRFGSRWRVVEACRVTGTEAVLDLRLSAELERDLQDHPVHPALFDLATAGAQQLIPGWRESHPLFVPVSYGRVRLFRRLPARITSRIRYGGDGQSDGTLAQFDIVVLGQDGGLVADITGLTLMRVDDPEQLRHREFTPRHPAPKPARKPVPLEGWSAEEGRLLFRQAFAAAGSAHVLVTPGDPETYLRTLGAPASSGAEPVAQDLSRLEQALAALPQVQESAVKASAAGQESRIIACYVLRPDARATVSELRRALRERIPDGPMPQAFLELDLMPRRSDGSIDIAQLPDPWAGEGTRDEGPGTAMERLVASAWQELLGIDAVGRRDNFFDVGGHSLLSIRLITRLHHATKVRLRHEDIVVNTLEQLAARLEAGAQSAA